MKARKSTRRPPATLDEVRALVEAISVPEPFDCDQKLDDLDTGHRSILERIAELRGGMVTLFKTLQERTDPKRLDALQAEVRVLTGAVRRLAHLVEGADKRELSASVEGSQSRTGPHRPTRKD